MNKNFHIEKSDSFRVVGFLIQTTNQRREGRKAIPAHWARFKAENLEQPLLALADQEPVLTFITRTKRTLGNSSI